MWSELWADIHRYPGDGAAPFKLALSSPGFWGVLSYRLHRGAYELPRALQLPAKVVIKPFAIAARLITGIELPPETSIGPGLYIGHFGNIVLSPDAVLGRSCNLSQGVTIGVADSRDGKRGAPTLGDRVYVAPGAKVFGPIKVGDGVAIGANAVLNQDVEPGLTVAGVPARVVSQRGSQGLIDLRDHRARKLQSSG
jgi:serine O-acetyltransferase